MERNEELSLLESVMAATEVYAVVSGKVTAVNSELGESPEFINELYYVKIVSRMYWS